MKMRDIIDPPAARRAKLHVKMLKRIEHYARCPANLFVETDAMHAAYRVRARRRSR